jgi:hypothetical protein
MTSALRQKTADSKYSYDRAVVRVVFPDRCASISRLLPLEVGPTYMTPLRAAIHLFAWRRMVLQASFHPRDSVASLFAFVREHVRPERAANLVLYVGPPRRYVHAHSLAPRPMPRRCGFIAVTMLATLQGTGGQAGCHDSLGGSRADIRGARQQQQPQGWHVAWWLPSTERPPCLTKYPPFLIGVDEYLLHETVSRNRVSHVEAQADLPSATHTKSDTPSASGMGGVLVGPFRTFFGVLLFADWSGRDFSSTCSTNNVCMHICCRQGRACLAEKLPTAPKYQNG